MTNTKSKQETLPPGLYLIGDPTYFSLSERDFQQVLSGEDGVLTSESGEMFAIFHIGADGIYEDNEGFEYEVDSASIGAYPINSVDEVDTAVGRCVEFSEEVTVAFDKELGLLRLRFGEIEIELVDVLLREPLTRREGMSDLDWLRELAKAEYITAQYELYEKLKGDPETHREAIKWMFAAARGGNALAQYDAGYLRKYGEGHQKNYREAVKWFRLSADQELSLSQYELGDSYYHGQGVAEDSEEAAKWFRLSAEQGYSIAQDALGQCYYNGEGVERSDKDAIYWWEQAAEQGHELACLSLAKCYLGLEGSPKTEKNLQKAFELILPVLSSDSKWIFDWDGPDAAVLVTAANELLETRGDKENVRSDSRLPEDANFDDLAAFCYEHGLGVEKDVERAENIRNYGLG